MPCNIMNGISKVCPQVNGGIQNLWVFAPTPTGYTGPTGTNGVLTLSGVSGTSNIVDITGYTGASATSGGTFFNFYVDKDLSNIVATGNSPLTGPKVYNTVLTYISNSITSDKITVFDDLLSNKNFIFCFKDFGDNYYLVGTDRGCYSPTVVATGGTLISDAQNLTATINADETIPYQKLNMSLETYVAVSGSNIKIV